MRKHVAVAMGEGEVGQPWEEKRWVAIEGGGKIMNMKENQRQNLDRGCVSDLMKFPQLN